MLLNLQSISKNYGADEILSSINLTINENDKIGFIGINGSGKTTLMNIINGTDDDFSGTLSKKNSLSVGFLRQDMGLNEENTIFDEALSSFEHLIREENELEKITDELGKIKDPEALRKLSENYHKRLELFEQNKGYYYKNLTASTLKGLGYSESDFTRKIKNLSGGQKMRVALSKLLTKEPDLLLLDEPTNYLDISSIHFLETYLSQYSKSYIVISHDRYFLEKTANIIWEAENKGVLSYRGNYTAYESQKELLIKSQQKAYDKQQSYLKHQQEVIDKLKSFNREKSVKRAESREKQLAKVEVLDRPSEIKSSKFNFGAKDIITKNALRIQRLEVGYGNISVVNNINIEIKTGQKVGICGDNAAGKSTLLKTIAGLIPPMNGEIVLGSGVVCSYFRQHHEDLDENKTILEELSDYCGEDNLKIRNVLSNLLFFGDDVHKKIGVLSGGETGRIAVAKLMLTTANVLLLDEPTNHLDMQSKKMFEEAMKNYEGTLLVVSHDRYLLNSVSDRMLFIKDKEVYSYDFGYEKSFELFSTQTAIVEEEQTHEEIKVEEKKTPQLSKNMIRKYTERLPQIEIEIDKINEKIASIYLQMQEDSYFKDQKAAMAINNELEELKKTHADLEDEWLEVSEILDNL